jgi:Tfp pilus assembly protein PilO
MSRRVISLAVAASVGLLAVWYLILWSPQSSSLRQARADVAAASAKEQDLKAQVSALQKGRLLLPTKQQQLVALARAVPATPDIDRLIDDVNSAALASGVALQSLSPSPPAVTASGAAAGPTPMTVTMGISGTYFQVKDFVNQLTKMPRLTVVDGISFSAPDKSGKMSSSISAHVFVAAPATAPSSPTSTTATTTKGTQ